MTDLVDTEKFEMPENDVGRKVFTASIDFAHAWGAEDIPPVEVQVQVNIPEYCTGSGMGEKEESYEFEYDSLGYLTVSLPKMFEEFLVDYDEGYCEYDKRHLELMKTTLLNMVEKVDQKLKEESK